MEVKNNMETIKLREDYIKLGQPLKPPVIVQSVVYQKFEYQHEILKQNGSVETQRGKKLYDGDIVEFENEKIIITKQ